MTGFTSDPTLSDGSASRRTLHVDVRAVGSGFHVLRLWGVLPAGWCGHLTLGLARAAIGIERGHARRTGGSWEAEFHLRPSDDGADPSSLDYAKLLGRRSAPTTEVPITLVDYRVQPLLGTLALEIEGEDCVGFLGSFLGRLAFLSLFPEEMKIETRGTRVHDSFRLRSMAGRAPSSEAPRALDRMLWELARRNRPAPE